MAEANEDEGGALLSKFLCSKGHDVLGNRGITQAA